MGGAIPTRSAQSVGIAGGLACCIQRTDSASQRIQRYQGTRCTSIIVGINPGRLTGERERLAAEHRVEMVVVEREADNGVRSIGRWRLRLHGSAHLVIERTTDGATVLDAVAVLVHARQDATIGAGRDDLGLIGITACFAWSFGLHGLVATGIIAIGKAARLGIDINRADGHLPLIAIVAGGRRLGEGVLLGSGQTTLSIVAHARTIMSTRPGTVDIRRGRGDGTPCAAVEAGCKLLLAHRRLSGPAHCRCSPHNW